MARSTLKPGSQASEAVDENKSTALAPQQSADVGDYTPAYDPEQYDDTSRDVDVPVLGLINNIGDLARQFKNKAGNFVLGSLFLGETVDVIPVQLVKYFRETHRNGEKLQGTPLARTAKVWATASDAAKDKYYVDFTNKAPNRIEEAGRIGYLVIAPQGDTSGEFYIKAGELNVAQGKSSYQRGGFRECWGAIYNFAFKLASAKGLPTKGISHTQLFTSAQPWTHRWTLRAKEEANDVNAWYEPRAARGAELSPETVAYITANYAK